jgi:hypothetical protein
MGNLDELTMRKWALLLVAVGLAPSVAAAPAPLPKEEPKFEFRMVNAPWREVFKWLINSTEVPVCTTFMPTGTFTFVGQMGATYTTSQIVDIINQALARHDCYLFRRPRFFVLEYVSINDLLLALAPAAHPWSPGTSRTADHN